MRIRPNSPRANEEKLSGLGEGLKEVLGLKKFWIIRNTLVKIGNFILPHLFPILHI